MNVTVFDHSTVEDQRSIELAIFRPLMDQFPKFNAGDVLLAFSVKVKLIPRISTFRLYAYGQRS